MELGTISAIGAHRFQGHFDGGRLTSLSIDHGLILSRRDRVPLLATPEVFGSQLHENSFRGTKMRRIWVVRKLSRASRASGGHQQVRAQRARAHETQTLPDAGRCRICTRRIAGGASPRCPQRSRHTPACNVGACRLRLLHHRSAHRGRSVRTRYLELASKTLPAEIAATT